MATQSIMQIIIEAIDKASAAFKNISSNAKKMQGETSKAGSTTVSSFDKATNAILDYAAGFLTVAAATKAATMAWDAAKMGARMESTTLAAANLAAGMGSNLNEIVNSIQKASFGTVSEFDAIQASSNAMMLGLGADSQKLGNLMQIAALRGRAMGLSTTQAFSDMVRGIGRLSPMILDNLGIVVDAEATFANYAASVGKTADQLTSAEKRQALLNRVLQEGNALLEQSGGLAMDVATAYDRVSAKWTDIGNSIKRDFAYGLLPLITTKEELVKLNELRAKSALIEGDYNEYMKARWQIASASTAPVVLMTESQFGLVHGTLGLIDAGKKQIKVMQESSGETAKINQGLALQAGLAGNLTKIYEEYDAAMVKANKDTKGQAAAIKKLSESTSDFLYSLASSALGDNVQGQTSLAFALGKIDESSMNAAIAVDALGQAYRNGKISLTQYLNGIMGIKSGLESLPKNTVLSVDMVFRMGGVVVPGMHFNQLMGQWYPNMPNITGISSGDMRASGGPVSAGSSYIVGERGPEMFVPNQSGQIIPNNQLGAARMQVLNFTYAPTVSTASQSEIEWILKPAIKKVMREYA